MVSAGNNDIVAITDNKWPCRSVPTKLAHGHSNVELAVQRIHWKATAALQSLILSIRNIHASDMACTAMTIFPTHLQFQIPELGLGL